jgi:hypothetical protein
MPLLAEVFDTRESETGNCRSLEHPSVLYTSPIHDVEGAQLASCSVLSFA